MAADLGLEMKSVISKMDVPIGRYIGNALEVAETIECLKGKGSDDVTDLVKTLGGQLLLIKGIPFYALYYFGFRTAGN